MKWQRSWRKNNDDWRGDGLPESGTGPTILSEWPPRNDAIGLDIPRKWLLRNSAIGRGIGRKLVRPADGTMLSIGKSGGRILNNVTKRNINVRGWRNIV